MSDELRECPFCGATPDISDPDMLIADEDGDWARLWCEKCFASGPAIRTHDRPAEDCVDDAVAAWNRRTTSPSVSAIGAETEGTYDKGILEALAFAKSVILSGEPWTETCERVIQGAINKVKGVGSGHETHP